MRKRHFLMKAQGWVCVLGLAGIVLACLMLITVMARAQGYGGDRSGSPVSASPESRSRASDLYVTYRGKNSSQIILRTFNPAGAGQWSPEWAIPKASSDVAPALLHTDRYLLIVYKDKSSGRLIWRTFDGSRWSDKREIGKSKTENPPSLALFNGTVYLAYRAYPTSRIFLRTFDGQRWSEEYLLSVAESTAGPVLTVYANDLLLAYKGLRDNRIYVRGFDGHEWSAQHVLPHAETGLQPTMATVGQSRSNNLERDPQLWVAYQGINSSKVFYLVWDGYRWSEENKVPDVDTSSPPVLFSAGNALYLAYQGQGSSKVYLRQWNPSPWSSERPIPSESSMDVAAVRF